MFGMRMNREWLSRRGVDLHLSTMSVWQGVVDGGLSQRGVFSTSYDVQAYLHSCKLGLWRNGYGLVRFEGKTDDAGVNPYTGALIPVNVDAMSHGGRKNAQLFVSSKSGGGVTMQFMGPGGAEYETPVPRDVAFAGNTLDDSFPFVRTSSDGSREEFPVRVRVECR